jgi:NADH:ubiquinone reductase (non-electrogenic)
VHIPCPAGARVQSLEPSTSPDALPTSAVVNLDLSSSGSPPPSNSEPQDGPSTSGSSSSHTRVNADLVLWTAGSSPVTKEARSGFPFPTTSRGSLQTVRGGVSSTMHAGARSQQPTR